MADRIRLYLRNDFVVATIIAVIWQIAMTVVGNILLPDPNGRDIWYHTTIWDGGWYLSILNDHYATNPASPAFYPLYPLLIGFISVITFHLFSYATVAFFVNTIALSFALAGILAITRHFGIVSNHRYFSTVLILLSPAAFFLHMFYGEALFIAISSWAYVFALRRQWLLACTLLGVLTASRLPALLIIGLCGLEFLRSYNYSIKKALNPKLLYFLITPIGFIAYGLYLKVIRGDFFAMFSAYDATNDWTYQIFNPNFLYPIAKGAYQTILATIGHMPLTSELVVNVVIPLFSLTLLLICSIYLIRVKGAGIPLGITGLVSIVFFTLNSNLVSVHRYTLPCIGIYVALSLAYIAHKKIRPYIIALSCIGFFIQLTLMYWLYTTSKFVG